MKFTTFTMTFCMMALFQTILAQTLTITFPVEGFTLYKNQPQRVTWIGDLATHNKQIKIQLMKGNANALQLVKTLAENVNVSDYQKEFTVPADVPEGDGYALAVGEAPSIAYMGKISIRNQNNDIRKREKYEQDDVTETKLTSNGVMTYSVNLNLFILISIIMVTLF
ncbi:hypothetical protein BJ944DRAFT_230655 [Cunninghamella echinulata]|nr:hypothetical protein BJ944DRAFT_230655 [Cunninghamella echinulata]